VRLSIDRAHTFQPYMASWLALAGFSSTAFKRRRDAAAASSDSSAPGG